MTCCDVDKTNEFHVFISYCWAAQKDIVLRIADRLKTEGFKIWLDEEQMCTYQFGIGHIIVSSHRECVSRLKFLKQPPNDLQYVIFNIVSFSLIYLQKLDK